MAATAAAAVGSSFSPSINTLKCIHSNHSSSWPSDYALKMFMSPTRIVGSVSQSYCLEPVVVSGVARKWRLLKISAAVTQEEAAVEEEEKGVEVEVDAVEGGGDDQVIGEADGALNTKLYFGNLPYNVDSAQLAGIIQDYASPELVEVLYDRDTGRSRGFAFVTMSSVEDCNAVIENLDGSEYLGRTLRVNLSNKPRPKEPLYPETEYKLFVGNLAWTVTTESLMQAFQEYGNVVGARVLYDGDTGRSRGYGFVCYSTKAEMEAALTSLDGVELEGRGMRVSLAEGRKS
ncbi:29 kDa ribonucleoprotein chloroplastic-like [Tripterygium wilfordii]|uniref:29 kDa ribonucleoprotein chloroplastic-like n=1 Tax=Tripterygium wilfordii TaxID=458696 RepID=A0A7J7CWS2_TRIWF|nr:28 kDa ribonucleoprotein, chloroplastic [Tripterygium wilfordii]KAF5738541.1 29 kDa ribonucleoprotein chloroplastic-like [Tripterygium wilfordii]